MTEIPIESVDAKRAVFEAEFEQLLERIATYAFTDGESEQRIVDSLLAFTEGRDPVGQVRGIAKDVSILEAGLQDPDLIPNAIDGLLLIGNGPAYEGYQLMISTFARNKEQIRAAINSPDAGARQGAIQLFLSTRQEPGNEDAWQTVEDNAEVIASDLAVISTVDDINPAVYTLSRVLRAEEAEPDKNVSRRVFGYLAQWLETGEISEDQLVEILAGLSVQSLAVAESESYADQVNGFLNRKGVSPVAKFLDYWHREGSVQEEIELNLKTIADIEKKRPGITQVLHDEFGIRHFSRYSPQSLIAQYDSRDDVETPYGIVISAQRDWNGSFRSNRHNEDWDKLSRDLGGQYLVRFLEIEDGVDLVKKLRTLNWRYGGNRISFVFLNAHSNERLVEIDENKKITAEDLSRGRGDILRTYLTPEAVVSLIGCSSGKKGDLANQLAEKFGLKVIASKGLAERVTVRVIDFDPLDFKVVFHRGPREKQIKGEPRGGAVVYDYRMSEHPRV